MKNTYSNLVDSVIYNRKDPYRPKSLKLGKDYQLRLQSLMIKANNGSIRLGLTLNQISDNPIFYNVKDSDYFENLKSAIEHERAFISTFKDYNVVTYARDMTLASFRKQVGDDGQQYISSILNDFTEDYGYDKNDRLLAKAYVGTGTPVKVSNDDRSLIRRGQTEMPVKDFFDTVSRSKKVGMYKALQLEELNDENIPIKVSTLHTNVWDIHRTALAKNAYKPNAPFAHDNGITCLSVLRTVVKHDGLMKKLYDATVANELKNYSCDEIIAKIRDAARDERIDEATSRSALYKHIPMFADYVRRGMGISEAYFINEKKSSVILYIWQLVCFAYNYYNSLLVFGDADYIFEFHPFTIANGSYGKINNPIIIDHNLFKPAVLYKIQDSVGRTLGKYQDFGSAHSALSDMPDNSVIVDLHGSVIAQK